MRRWRQGHHSSPRIGGRGRCILCGRFLGWRSPEWRCPLRKRSGDAAGETRCDGGGGRGKRSKPNKQTNKQKNRGSGCLSLSFSLSLLHNATSCLPRLKRRRHNTQRAIDGRASTNKRTRVEPQIMRRKSACATVAKGACKTDGGGRDGCAAAVYTALYAERVVQPLGGDLERRRSARNRRKQETCHSVSAMPAPQTRNADKIKKKERPFDLEKHKYPKVPAWDRYG